MMKWLSDLKDPRPKYYNQDIYLPSGDYTTWIDFFLEKESQTCDLLDFCTGLWKDAYYIESRGYMVDRTDTEKEFVEYNHFMGNDCKLIEHYDYSFNNEEFDLFFSNGVLGSFSKSEFTDIISILSRKLRKSWKLALSFPVSPKNSLSNEIWTKEELYQFFWWQDYSLPYLEYTSDQDWLFLVAEKMDR